MLICIHGIAGYVYLRVASSRWSTYTEDTASQSHHHCSLGRFVSQTASQQESSYSRPYLCNSQAVNGCKATTVSQPGGSVAHPCLSG